MWGDRYTEQWISLLGIWRKAVSLKDLAQTRDSTLGWNRTEVIRIFLHFIKRSHNFHFLDLVPIVALKQEVRKRKKLWERIKRMSVKSVKMPFLTDFHLGGMGREDQARWRLVSPEKSVWSCPWHFYALESCLHMEALNWWCLKWSLATYQLNMSCPLPIHVLSVALILFYSVVALPELRKYWNKFPSIFRRSCSSK